MARGSYDTGAGLPFVQLVDLARSKGFVNVTFATNGAQYLYLVTNKRL
jgi:hypothetical protein